MKENPLCKKFRIKEAQLVCAYNAPNGFAKTFSPLPKKTKVVDELQKNVDSIHWFVKNKSEMESEMKKVLGFMSAKTTVWIYYPKISSGIQTDLTRDKGWDSLMKLDHHWLALVSYNDVWSAFSFRMKNEADKKREAAPRERAIQKWIDPITKTVNIPAELNNALKKNKTAEKYFHSLAFSHRREYVEYIVEAKKPETRERRIVQTIDMLNRQKKNPQEGRVK